MPVLAPRLVGITSGRGLDEVRRRLPGLVAAGLPAAVVRETAGELRELADVGCSVVLHDRHPHARAACAADERFGLHVPGGRLALGLRGLCLLRGLNRSGRLGCLFRLIC